MKNIFFFVYIFCINYFYVLSTNLKSSTNNLLEMLVKDSAIEYTDNDIILLENSQEKIINNLIDKNISFEKSEFENKLKNLFEVEISNYIKLFQIKNTKSLEKKENKNLNYRRNFKLINNSEINLNENNSTDNHIKDLSKKILNKIICKNKRHLLRKLLNEKIINLRINKNLIFPNLKNNTSNSSNIIDNIFQNKLIEEKEKQEVKNEIQQTLQKSNKSFNIYSFSQYNTNEIFKIINETLFCKNFCSNNGYCFNGICYCIPGFKGSDCSINKNPIKKCPNKCSNNGKCQNNGICLCNNTFSGLDCSIKGKII